MGKSQVFAYADRAAAIIAEERNAVGRIKKRYGTIERSDGERRQTVDGALLVTLFDAFPETVDFHAEPLWIECDSRAVPLFVASFERRGNGAAVVLFDDFERAETAELLVGKVLHYEGGRKGARTGASEGEGADFEALIGYELTDSLTGRRGTVVAFYDYPGNPLLGVDFEGREVMVPAAEGLVEVASVRRRQLRAELPEGLFDL